MSVRVQLVLNEHERELFRRQASAEGLTLSAWLRKAARERLESRHAEGTINSAKELKVFFDQCDQREKGLEPDWAEHLAVIRQSIKTGQSET